MTNLTIFLTCLLVISGCSTKNETSQTDDRSPVPLEIMFYNVENLFDTTDDPDVADEEFTPDSDKKYTEERYTEKIDHLSKVIASANNENLPEIIGLCEVENRGVVEKLFEHERFEGKNYKIVHKDSPDGRGIDVALVYDADLLKIDKEDFFKVVIPEAERPNTRDILYARAIGKNDTLHLFVNHWPSRYGGQEKSEPKRLEAASILRSRLDSLRKENPDARFVIMGDFNDYPVNKSLTDVIGAKSDTTSEIYNMMAPLHDQGLGTYNYRGEWGALDQFLVSNSTLNGETGFTTNSTDVEIIREEWMMYVNKEGEAYPSRSYGGPNYYGGYSDHLPILMRMEIR